MTGLDSRAKQYSLKLLSYKGRSEKEMEERLRKKGVSSQVISSTIQYLKDAGLLDDRSLAENLKREALSIRMLSQYGARNFMLSKGIPKSIVNSVFGSAEHSDFDNAVRLVDKKLKVLGKYPPATVERRLHNLLARRGYSAGTIMKVLKHKKIKEDDQ